jgi:prophage regulatory protein
MAVDKKLQAAVQKFAKKFGNKQSWNKAAEELIRRAAKEPTRRVAVGLVPVVPAVQSRVVMEEIKTPKRATRTVRMLRMPEVEEKTGRSRTMHYEDIRRGLMTPGVALGARCSGWPEHELDAILAARIAGASDDDVCQIVQRLMDERRAALPGFTPSPGPSKTRSRGHKGRFVAERRAGLRR